MFASVRKRLLVELNAVRAKINLNFPVEIRKTRWIDGGEVKHFRSMEFRGN